MALKVKKEKKSNDEDISVSTALEIENTCLQSFSSTFRLFPVRCEFIDEGSQHSFSASKERGKTVSFTFDCVEMKRSYPLGVDNVDN